MALPQTYRIDPLDLDPNIGVGISLPFNAGNVFTSTFSTKDQIKYNLINVLLTNKGERVENPKFGSDLKRFIFEVSNDESYENIREEILFTIERYFRNKITVTNISITPFPDNNLINIKIDYTINLSGQNDSISVNFE